MIISKQNSLIKKIRSLEGKKFRDEYNEYLVEGYKMVNEAIRLGQNVKAVVCTEKGQSLLDSNQKIFGITSVVSDEVFDYITGEVTPQGVMAILEKPNVNPAFPKQSCVFLDGVRDPQNVGAIIRNCAASGYNEVYLADCADAFSPKSVRASMSGIYNVTVYVGKKEELIEKINCPIIIADMEGENVKDFVAPEKFCLVIGSEAHGVSDFVMSKSNHTVKIPMKKDMESLNASVSSGILMYALKKFNI